MSKNNDKVEYRGSGFWYCDTEEAGERLAEAARQYHPGWWADFIAAAKRAATRQMQDGVHDYDSREGQEP